MPVILDLNPPLIINGNDNIELLMVNKKHSTILGISKPQRMNEHRNLTGQTWSKIYDQAVIGTRSKPRPQPGQSLHVLEVMGMNEMH
jgi:hypothetical protein